MRQTRPNGKKKLKLPIIQFNGHARECVGYMTVYSGIRLCTIQRGHKRTQYTATIAAEYPRLHTLLGLTKI